MLVSFPKTGSTWVRFLLCNIIALSELSGRAVDFQFLDDTMPAMGYSNLREAWPYESIPRCVKTHQGYYPILFARPKKVVYIFRDPRDIMVSRFHFQRAALNQTAIDEFSSFIRDTKYGLRRCIQHYVTWRDHMDHLVRYENLKKDTQAELSSLLHVLETTIGEDVIAGAVERSKLNQVRSAQARTGLSGEKRFKKDFVFARSGATGEWKDYFSADDLQYYQAVCDEFAFDLYPLNTDN